MTAFTYNTDDYAATGYFLAQEESFSADAFAVSQATGDIYSTMDLLGDGYSVSTSEGDVLSTMELLGDGYSVSQGTGDVLSTMGLLGDGYSIGYGAGDLYSTMDIFGGGASTSLCSGNIYSTMGLVAVSEVVSSANAFVTVSAPNGLNFSIKSLSNNYSIRQLNNVN